MVRNLQKNAEFYRDNVGVIDPEGFARRVNMQFYEPSPDLKPFVTHYFIASYNLGTNNSYTASDILTRPDVHVVFASSGASIIGPMTAKRSLHLENKGVYAGIRFTSGGFYPFWSRPMSQLMDHVFPITEIIPAFEQSSVAQLLTKKDAAIVKDFEALLRAQKPKDNLKIHLINSIIDAIESDPELVTISAVARTFKLSDRTLQQLFKTYVGAGIKWIIMRNRFLRAISHVHNVTQPNWTMIAAELEYSTQSHFNNDFKKIMGQTPREYFRAIAVSSHNN